MSSSASFRMPLTSRVTLRRSVSISRSAAMMSAPRRRHCSSHEETDADADQHGRDRVAPDQIGHVVRHPFEAFLFQVAAGTFQRVGHRVTDGPAVWCLLANALTQRFDAAADARRGALGLLTDIRSRIFGRMSH